MFRAFSYLCAMLTKRIILSWALLLLLATAAMELGEWDFSRANINKVYRMMERFAIEHYLSGLSQMEVLYETEKIAQLYQVPTGEIGMPEHRRIGSGGHRATSGLTSVQTMFFPSFVKAQDTLLVPFWRFYMSMQQKTIDSKLITLNFFVPLHPFSKRHKKL